MYSHHFISVRSKNSHDVELDLRSHNLGLNTAWMRAQDRSKWRRLCSMMGALRDDNDDDDDDTTEITKKKEEEYLEPLLIAYLIIYP